jgi:UbiD family decarboxylase
MPYASLREFIDRLEAAGRLVRVKTAVSPDLEMTEIQTRLLAEGGPAVLFENVIGETGDETASLHNCARWVRPSPFCGSPSRRAAGVRRSTCYRC